MKKLSLARNVRNWNIRIFQIPSSEKFSLFAHNNYIKKNTHLQKRFARKGDEELCCFFFLFSNIKRLFGCITGVFHVSVVFLISGKCLHLSGLTPEPLTAEDDYKLLDLGIGFTNMVARATKGSADLTRKEIKEGSTHFLFINFVIIPPRTHVREV